MEVRREEHTAFYHQNCELWKFLESLLHVHAENGRALQERVCSMETELRRIVKGKENMKTRIESSRKVEEEKSLLLERQEEVQAELMNEKELYIQAKEAFSLLQEEQTVLEQEFAAKKNRLENIISSLENYRFQHREEESTPKADHFFHHNRAVLRGAFHRFRCKYSEKTRIKKCFAKATSLYHRKLKYSFFVLWKLFHVRRKRMMVGRRNRDLEIKIKVFSRWTVYAALEGHFGRMLRRRRLRLIFRILVEHYHLERRNQWASDATLAFLERRILRAHFGAWKSESLFIEWRSPVLKSAEKKALRFFISKVLKAWLLAARSSRRLLCQAALNVVRNRVRRPFAVWYRSTTHHLRRREILISQFFVGVKWRALQRSKDLKKMRDAMILCPILKKQGALRRWKRYISLQGNSDSSTRVHIRARTLEYAIQSLSLRIISQKRLHSAYQLAVRFHTQGVLRFWRRLSHRWRRGRASKRLRRMQLSFAKWVAYVPFVREHRRIETEVEAKFSSAQLRRRKFLLLRWFSYSRKRRYLLYAADMLIERLGKKSLRSSVSIWSCQWSRALLWREREAKVELERHQALNQLRYADIKHLEEEREYLSKAAQELRSSLAGLRQATISRENDLRSLDGEILALRACRTESDKILQDLRSNLRCVSQGF